MAVKMAKPSAQDLQDANLDNLVKLWQTLGATEIKPGIFESVSWPHRLWCDWQVDDGSVRQQAQTDAWLHHAKQSERALFLTHWPDQQEKNDVDETSKRQGTSRRTKRVENLQKLFFQTGMVLDAKSARPQKPVLQAFSLQPITNTAQSDEWTQVAARGFNYEIPNVVMQPLLKEAKAQRWMLCHDNQGGQGVASALVFHSETEHSETDPGLHIAGIHLVAVLPDYRGQGLARLLMQSVLHELVNHSPYPIDYFTLQASAMGEGLYDSLGFTTQFELSHYAVPEKVALFR